MATLKPRKLSTLMNTDALQYALYTIQERAIPNMIDGFKPVHRFVMYSALRSANSNMKKVASVCGVVSDLGYHHGETAAQDAACLLAAEWCNNYPFLEGEGSFGSRMIQDPAQARYVFCRVHYNFKELFRDLDIIIPHEDPEHEPPKYYVPIVPVVLLNGVFGIATGYSSTILPHSLEWVTACTEQKVKTGKIDIPNVDNLQFPEYFGLIVKDDIKLGRYFQYGRFEVSGYTVDITDIPTNYSHEDYIAVLERKLADKKIVSYEDLTSEEFKFKVKMKRGTEMTFENIASILELKISKPFNENINVIRPDGLLHHYDDPRDLISDFVDYRLGFLQKRIDKKLQDTTDKIELLTAKIDFISGVNNNTIDLKQYKLKELIHFISTNFTKKYSDQIAKLTISDFTEDEVKKLQKELDVNKKDLEYWQKTTSKKEYLKDIKELKKALL